MTTYKIKTKSFRRKDTYNTLTVYAMKDFVVMRVLKTFKGPDVFYTITIKQFTKNAPIIMEDKDMMIELANILETSDKGVEYLMNEGIHNFKINRYKKEVYNIDNVNFINGLIANKEEKQIMQSRLDAFKAV